MFKEPEFNYSGDFPFRWDELKLPIRYGCDLKKARSILENVAAEICGPAAESAAVAWTDVVSRFRIENARLHPLVTMTANDNWVEFTLRYVVDYKARRATKDMLFKRILEELDATDGGVAIASTTLQSVDPPRIRGEVAP